MVLLHGAAAWCSCCMVQLLHGAPAAATAAAAAATATATAADTAAATAAPTAAATTAAAAAAAAVCNGSSSNFLIYKIEAAVEAAPAIFGRYLVTQWRQLLAAADAFRAEHWVQSRR